MTMAGKFRAASSIFHLKLEMDESKCSRCEFVFATFTTIFMCQRRFTFISKQRLLTFCRLIVDRKFDTPVSFQTAKDKRKIKFFLI